MFYILLCNEGTSFDVQYAIVVFRTLLFVLRVHFGVVFATMS